MPPSAVWAVMSDGWLYPVWVVGAARMREVDDHWPAVGSWLHHSVGIWPLLINDNTESSSPSPTACSGCVRAAGPLARPRW